MRPLSNGAMRRVVTNNSEASTRAQNESFNPPYRQHVVMLRTTEGREFKSCGDAELEKMQREKAAVWCGGYYKGAFTG